MEEPKKKKNQPKVEIHWNVIEKQYGEINTNPLLAQLQQQQLEDRLLLLARELDFGHNEVKANSAGKLTQKQRHKLALTYNRANSSVIICMVFGLLLTAIASIFGMQTKVYFGIILFTMAICLWLRLQGLQQFNHRVTVQHSKAYLVSAPSPSDFLLVASDKLYYPPSSWEITIPVSEKLYNAFKDSTDLYHIYYTVGTNTVLSVERAEEMS